MHIAMTLDAWEATLSAGGDNTLRYKWPKPKSPMHGFTNNKRKKQLQILRSLHHLSRSHHGNIRRLLKYPSSQHNTGQIDSIIIRQTPDSLPFQQITLICPVLDMIRK